MGNLDLSRDYNLLRGVIYALQIDQVARLDLFRSLDRLYERIVEFESSEGKDRETGESGETADLEHER